MRSPLRVAAGLLFVFALALATGRVAGARPTPDDGPTGGGASEGAGGSSSSDGGGSTSRGLALPGGAPEIAGYKDKVVFVLDRSGSMALADRFLTAVDIVEQLILEMPRDTKFDIYLATETSPSLFNGDWYKASGDMRKQLRTRIAEAGGLDYGGYTDLVTPVKMAAEKRRPDAVYVLSDGVATIGELETEKIIAAASKAAAGLKIPVHTIALGVGQDAAEDPAQALAVLKGIAQSTAGIFREVRCETRSKGRAFLQHPLWAPPLPEDLAKIHLKDTKGKEMRTRQFGGKTGLGEVLIEIEDPTISRGSVPFEYAEPRLVIRTFMQNGRPFFETRPLPLKRIGDRFACTWSIRVVSAADDSPDEPTSGGQYNVKCPTGGSIDVVYRRGSREFKETATMQASQQ